MVLELKSYEHEGVQVIRTIANVVVLGSLLGIYAFVFLEIAKSYIREDRSDWNNANPAPFEAALAVSVTGLVAMMSEDFLQQITSSIWWLAGYVISSWYLLRLVLRQYVCWVYPGTTFMRWYRVEPQQLGTKRRLPASLTWLHFFT